MSDLGFYLERAESSKEKQKILKAQHMDLCAGTMTTMCPDCRQLRHFTLLFKCLYCGVYFCRNCAEKHFGKTIDEYYNPELRILEL